MARPDRRNRQRAQRPRRTRRPSGSASRRSRDRRRARAQERRPARRWAGRPAEDRDDPRRVAERGHLAQELRQNVLPGDQQLDRLDAGGGCSLDEVLALGGEQPCLRGASSQREASGRAGASRSDATRSGGTGPGSASSAALARSATAANAWVETAMSASDLRSSSIPAFLTPAMKRLYERPFTRAAALMRTIQSERNVRLRALRSRYVDERVLDLLLREAVARLLAAVVALRLLEDLALLARVDCSLDAGHRASLPSGAS